MAQAIGRLSRGFQRTRTYPIASGASFKAGQFLIWNAGLTRHASSNADTAATSSTTRIAGMALEDSTKDDGSAKAIAAVMIAEPGTEFLLPLYSATPANAVITPNGQIGTLYELRNVSGNYDAVNIDATTNTKLAIVDFATEDDSAWPGRLTDTGPGNVTAGTTQYANVWVEFQGSCVVGAAGR